MGRSAGGIPPAGRGDASTSAYDYIILSHTIARMDSGIPIFNEPVERRGGNAARARVAISKANGPDSESDPFSAYGLPRRPLWSFPAMTDDAGYGSESEGL